jgi:FkbM family methyltransferase
MTRATAFTAGSLAAIRSGEHPTIPAFSSWRACARWVKQRWLAAGPSLAEWEARLRRLVAEPIARSLPWIPREDAVVIDVGANVGLYTEGLLAARPGLRAYLFEPVRRYHSRCVQRHAGRASVRCENLALGDENATLTIWKPLHNPGGNSLATELVFQRMDSMCFRPEEVECRVFDDYAREVGLEHADFVKVDTEGYDYRVLRGMLGFLELSERRPVLLVELLARSLHNDWEGQREVVEELYRLGYDRVDLDRLAGVEDVLFVPRGRRRVA